MLREINRIAIWGYGREGRSALKEIRARYPATEIFIVDNIAQDEEGVTALLSDAGEEKIAAGDFDLIVKSPGISLYKDVIQRAKDKGTLFSSATNLWFEKYPEAKTIAVTGTKGKSTTSSLIHHLLREAGTLSVLAGNIGIPMLDVPPGHDVTVLELSSYQIADLSHAPDVALILNLYPEHSDWHGSADRYYADKMRLAQLADKLVTNAQDDRLASMLKRDKNISYFHEIPFDPSMPEFFKGAHNRKNLAAALAAIEAAGLDAGHWHAALYSYKPLPHRQEVIAEINNVRWINDSISTVPETAMAALSLYDDRPVTLLLGGQDRGQDYTSLAKAIAVHGMVKVLTMPDNGPRISEIIPSTACLDLKEAVRRAHDITPTGGVVLLSPAAPSYGRFINFEDRGNQFRELVRSL